MSGGRTWASQLAKEEKWKLHDKSSHREKGKCPKAMTKADRYKRGNN